MVGINTHLKLLERGIKIVLSDKFVKVEMEVEEDKSLRIYEIACIGSALGKTLDEIEYPIHWERFLKRKDCPAYLREITKVNVNVYFPDISLPEEPHWVSFDRVGTDE